MPSAKTIYGRLRITVTGCSFTDIDNDGRAAITDKFLIAQAFTYACSVQNLVNAASAEQ